MRGGGGGERKWTGQPRRDPAIYENNGTRTTPRRRTPGDDELGEGGGSENSLGGHNTKLYSFSLLLEISSLEFSADRSEVPNT